jgi:hypothetical protein
MKKQFKFLIIMLLTVILSSCITSQDEVNKAKQNLWIQESWTNQNILNSNSNSNNKLTQDINNKENITENTWSDIKQDSIDTIKNELLKEKPVKEESKKIEITSLTDNQFLELDDLSWKDLLWWAVEITWKTLSDVDKIIVTYKNDTSDFPDDRFQLKQFKPWDKTFLYRAFSKYETLDFGKNVYVFEAYKWNEITKLQLIINVKKDEKKNRIIEKLDISKLPVNEKFWNPMDLWEWKIGYTDLKWLEIKSENIPELVCEKVTTVLADRIKGWFFWNTCRPIKDKEWVSFYVIRLDWDKYIYEKHYYLPYQWIYGVQELETWTWVTNSNIWEKNSELKEKNKDFSILWITDDLFKEIIK